MPSDGKTTRFSRNLSHLGNMLSTHLLLLGFFHLHLSHSTSLMSSILDGPNAEVWKSQQRRGPHGRSSRGHPTLGLLQYQSPAANSSDVLICIDFVSQFVLSSRYSKRQSEPFRTAGNLSVCPMTFVCQSRVFLSQQVGEAFQPFVAVKNMLQAICSHVLDRFWQPKTIGKKKPNPNLLRARVAEKPEPMATCCSGKI